MRKSKGSMVIYLAIIMPVFILFFGIYLDVARIKYTRSKVSAGLYSSLDSILADYNREVLGSYGIFVIAEKDYSRDFQGFIRGNSKGFSDVEDLSPADGGEGDYIENLNDKVKRNMEEIKSLESRRENGEEVLDGRIEELYG